ncbi:hypothetical protein DFS34DRAFT_638338 [Phlyctochytrium arcticum]|nr:hypothetical protein DFS34DRAFT_638338 [Phlyctochytrium arcticum]
MYLAEPEKVLTSGDVDEIRFSNIIMTVPFITPPPSFVENACSGGTKNQFKLHMSGVRSLKAFNSCFVDDDTIGDRTKDKALSFNSQGLKEWRITLGPNLHIPSGSLGFTHGPNDPTTLLLTELSANNSWEALADLDTSSCSRLSQPFHSYQWRSNI